LGNLFFLLIIRLFCVLLNIGHPLLQPISPLIVVTAPLFVPTGVDKLNKDVAVGIALLDKNAAIFLGGQYIPADSFDSIIFFQSLVFLQDAINLIRLIIEGVRYIQPNVVVLVFL
jgi:hypothetical protein